ncbi:MAG: class I SAM-dependent methyltransferase, partial [Novosphingobium sp.]
MTTGMDWAAQVGRNWAEMSQWTDRSFGGLTHALLERIAVLPAGSILDVGCGAGELSLAVGRIRPEARVVGLDLSPDLLAVARSRGQGMQNVVFVEGDAASWEDPAFAPDAVISRHGVMFFADPVSGFRHLHDIGAPGAGLAFTCFRQAAENSWASGITALVPDRAASVDPHAPGPFAFADPEYVGGILDKAGWIDVDFAPVDYVYVAGDGSDPVAEAAYFFSRIGPAAAMLRELSDGPREAFANRLRDWLKEHCRDGVVSFP